MYVLTKKQSPSRKGGFHLQMFFCKGPPFGFDPNESTYSTSPVLRWAAVALCSPFSLSSAVWCSSQRTELETRVFERFRVAAGRKESARLLQRAQGLRRLLGGPCTRSSPGYRLIMGGSTISGPVFPSSTAKTTTPGGPPGLPRAARGPPACFSAPGACGGYSGTVHAPISRLPADFRCGSTFFHTPWTGSYFIWPMSIGILPPFFTTGLKFTWLNFEGNRPSKTNSAARRLADLISLYNSSGPGTGTAAHRMLPVGPQFGAFAPPKQDSAALFRYPSQAGSIRFNFVF